MIHQPLIPASAPAETIAAATRPLHLVELTAQIVAAHVGKTPTAVADVTALIRTVHASLLGLSAAAPAEKPAPAVDIKKSVTADKIICLEDGKPFKSLKRHLGSAYGMTPDDYRRKWGLPPTYPMVAPNYAKARSALAKQTGLGRKPKANGHARKAA
jgi:predicted transcriptional regulator